MLKPDSAPDKPKPAWKKYANVVAMAALAAVVVIAALSTTLNTTTTTATPVVEGRAGSPVIALTTVSPTEVIDTDVSKVATLVELLKLSPEERAEMDIARASLLIAKHTPGGENISINAYLKKIDEWARIVAAETDANMYQFRRDPANFENSEGYFRILSLITTLQRDLGVRYHPERINDPDFTSPADLFIHGMVPLAGTEAPGGTCVSMPVLYVAVAPGSATR